MTPTELAREWIRLHEEAVNKEGWTSVQVDQLAAVAKRMLDLEERSEPWSWIPHVEGADRQKEINAYLSKLVDEMPLGEPLGKQTSK